MPGEAIPVRTCRRSYVQDGARAGQVQRVHVVRETPTRSLAAGEQTLCGQHAYAVRQSEGIVRDAPHELPEGMSWCPTCTGRLAEVLGRTAEIAALLGLAPGEAR